MSKTPFLTDEVRIKSRLMKEIDRTQDLPTLIGLVGAWTKIRSMELKADEGDWGEGLNIPEPQRNLPPQDVHNLANPSRNPDGR